MGGAGGSLNDGFAIVAAAGRSALPVPLAETLLAGWLLAQAGIEAPAGAMTVAPARPRDRVTLNADGTLSGTVRGIPFAKDSEHIAVVASARQSRHHRAGQDRRLPRERRPKSRRRCIGHRDVRPRESRPQRAGAVRCVGADADGRDRAQPADCRRAGDDPGDERRLRQRARRLRAQDRQIPGGAAEPRAARRRDRRRARRRRLRRRHHRACRCLRRHGDARSRLGKNPRRRSGGGRRGHRASGVRRHRLHQRARAASLHAAHARLARRFRQRKPLGGGARRHDLPRAAPTSSGRCWRRDEPHEHQSSIRPDPPAARVPEAARGSARLHRRGRSPPAPSCPTGPATATPTTAPSASASAPKAGSA